MPNRNQPQAKRKLDNLSKQNKRTNQPQLTTLSRAQIVQSRRITDVALQPVGLRYLHCCRLNKRPQLLTALLCKEET